MFLQPLLYHVLKYQLYDNKSSKIVIKHLRKQNKKLKHKILLLSQKVKSMQNNCKCNKTMDEVLLVNDTECKFYTGINTLKLFNDIFDYVKPLVRRK